ncbi:MAG: hypothetical protein JWM33_970, partial [Caulobacteraceae bacterium]|nr:hypothetical protein [Caulobacteraceae bacterium]
GIYHRAYGRADHYLTFFAFNIAIFLIAFVLNSTELSMGAAFGLFAVFSMLRYRTEGISTNDMTYLFLGIALGLIMAISSLPLIGLAGVGLLLIGFIAVLESGMFSRRELRQDVLYDNIKLVHAHARPELLADLRARTGLNIHRVEVQEIDLVRDVASLAVYHHADASAAPRPELAITLAPSEAGG